MTLRVQCWLFATGSALFAAATTPGLASTLGSLVCNVLCFAGSWLFTTAALIQLRLSIRDWPATGKDESAWADVLAARVQFIGTVLFNVSTATAVWAHRAPTERDLVWTPDVVGSACFLLSSVVAVAAVVMRCSRLAWRSRDWVSGWVNVLGSVAFGVSAGGAFVNKSGYTTDEWLANAGTFVGALCFLAAALMSLPPRTHSASNGPPGPVVGHVG